MTPPEENSLILNQNKFQYLKFIFTPKISAVPFLLCDKPYFQFLTYVALIVSHNPEPY
jgi:hypothetical protein